MKKLIFVIAILLLSYCGFSQTLTGLWVGTLSNDSNTVRKDKSFEMALTEYRGKVYGYSYTTFMINDTLFYVVKRVKGTIDGDVCEVKDDELISCNFMSRLDKGVKQIYTFRLNTNDSLWRLDGNWKTNQTKKFYSISGSVKTATEKDLSKSKLFPHLQELNLNDAIAAIQPKKEPAPEKTAEPKQTDIAKTNTDNNNKPKDKGQSKQEATVSSKEIAKTTTDSNNKPKQKEQSKKQEPAVTATKDIAKTNTDSEKKKEDIPIKKDNPATNDIASVKAKEKTDLPVKPAAAANVELRKSEIIQSVEFVSDSITLALYDNGEIDGDTVSVLINGEVVMPKQGLKATAIKKTIYITPAMQDSFTLVLYAENLGSYPPNTGLIIVRDGEDSHQIRFSADLQKNVAVIFKRKKK